MSYILPQENPLVITLTVIPQIPFAQLFKTPYKYKGLFFFLGIRYSGSVILILPEIQFHCQSDIVIDLQLCVVLISDMLIL